MANGSKLFKDNAEKRGNQAFIAMRKDVLKSEAWARTSMKGRCLIMTLAGQYRGKNNGDLCSTFSVLRKCGWKSKDTLDKARTELIERGWIIRTRKGSRNVCSLYALTFWGIDECSKYDPDIRPSLKPRDSWKASNTAPADVAKKRQQRAAKINSAGPKFGQPWAENRPSEEG